VPNIRHGDDSRAVRERRGTTPLAHMTCAAHLRRWRAHPFGLL